MRWLHIETHFDARRLPTPRARVGGARKLCKVESLELIGLDVGNSNRTSCKRDVNRERSAMAKQVIYELAVGSPQASGKTSSLCCKPYRKRGRRPFSLNSTYE